ncbi:MAG TPA: hypothetical protein ENH62_17520 [Marinobacter sp.]|uniref:Uncharacterized protein n=1 Tax=marine sediment metagenome TaxID=412755 RepID=A0A0F9QXE3_9ZZZZ|nr:hypothetical protein [Marinobacter sp.]
MSEQPAAPTPGSQFTISDDRIYGEALLGGYSLIARVYGDPELAAIFAAAPETAAERDELKKKLTFEHHNPSGLAAIVRLITAERNRLRAENEVYRGLLSRMIGLFELYATHDTDGIIFRHESDAATYEKARDFMAEARQP